MTSSTTIRRPNFFPGGGCRFCFLWTVVSSFTLSTTRLPRLHLLPSCFSPSSGIHYSIPATNENVETSIGQDNNKNNNNDDDNKTIDSLSFHQAVLQNDPAWYRKYVLDILGEEFCQSKWPVIVDSGQTLKSVAVILNGESPKETVAEDANVDDSFTAATLESSSSSLKLTGTNTLSVINQNPLSKIAQPNGVPENEKSSLESETVAGKIDDTTEKILPIPESEPARSSEPQTLYKTGNPYDYKSTKSNTKDEVVKVQDTHDKNDGSNWDSLGISASITKSDDEVKEAQLSKDLMESANYANESDDVVLPVGDTTTRFVVYRNRKGGISTVPLVALLKLGYMAEEVLLLQPETLDIIVKDQVTRPRMGLPVQWKVSSRQDSSSGPLYRAQIVDTLEEAKVLRERDAQEERSMKSRKREAKDNMSSIQETKVLQRDKFVSTPNSKTFPISDKASVTTVGKTRNQTSSQSIEDVTVRKLKGDTSFKSKDDDMMGKSTNSSAARENFNGRSGDTEPRPNVATTGTEKFPVKEVGPVIVYKDMGNSLKSIPLSNMTNLGYRVEDILTLQDDALVVVVNDEIPRPRMGIPPQWKVGKGETNNIQILEVAEEAQMLIEKDLVEKGRRQTAETESMKSGRERRKKLLEDEENQVNSRQQFKEVDGRLQRRKKEIATTPPFEKYEAEDTLMEDTSRKRKARRMSDWNGEEEPSSRKVIRDGREVSSRVRRQGSASPGIKWQNEGVSSSSADLQPRRRRDRQKFNEDGTPKRIYNAREQLTTRVVGAIVRPDPPPLNSPVWVDMDTFRDLLRSEAEFRLRILGSDWAQSVKQESDWRLNLYRGWLWTLHNGVGSSIVPPSRYERARTEREKALPDKIKQADSKSRNHRRSQK